jgi:hypothetical protein
MICDDFRMIFGTICRRNVDFTRDQGCCLTDQLQKDSKKSAGMDGVLQYCSPRAHQTLDCDPHFCWSHQITISIPRVGGCP